MEPSTLLDNDIKLLFAKSRPWKAVDGKSLTSSWGISIRMWME